MHGFRTYASFIVAIIVIGGTLVAALAADDARRARDIAAEVLDTASLHAYAQERGDEAVIEYALSFSDSFDVAIEHQVGHALGQTLYERSGLSAISLCGDIFTYGCLHQVLGQAYAERGPTSLIDLAETCRVFAAHKYDKCLHALGHGLIYANGYDVASLRDSLTECDRLQSEFRFDYEDSCFGGAFMEYNMHFMSDNEGAYGTGREFDPNAPLAPCDALDDGVHRATCAFWLIPWYHGTFDRWSLDTEITRSLGDFCDAMAAEEMRVACTYAVGRQIAVKQYVPTTEIANLCESAFQDSLAFDRCIFGAVRILERERAAKAAELCAMTGSDHRVHCNAYYTEADNAGYAI